MKLLKCVCTAMILLALFLGCSNHDSDEEFPDVGEPILLTDSEMDYKNRYIHIGFGQYIVEEYHEISGTTRNVGISKAHNAFVMITIQDSSGMILHEKRVDLGDISPAAEESFTYEWIYPWSAFAQLEVKSYCDEIPY